MTVHLNNAGSGPMTPRVTDAVLDYVRREAEQGSYELEEESADVLDRGVYAMLGRLLHTDARDIAVFGSATAGWLAAVQAIPLRATDHVWVTPYEYAGNLIALSRLRERHGFTLRSIPLDEHGDLDLDWVASTIDERCALVSVPHVPSGCGIINPVEALGELLAGHRAFYVVDGCQAVGQVPVDLRSIRSDVYSGAGRKFLRGPRGTGFTATSPSFRASTAHLYRDLHVASTTPMPQPRTIVHDRSARGWEVAERHPAAVYGLALAVEEHLAVGADPYDTGPADLLRTHLAQMLSPHAIIDPGTRRSNIVTIDTGATAPARVVAELRRAGFNTWVMTGADTPTYMSMRRVEKAVRISPHYDTTATDIEDFCAALATVLDR